MSLRQRILHDAWLKAEHSCRVVGSCRNRYGPSRADRLTARRWRQLVEREQARRERSGPPEEEYADLFHLISSLLNPFLR